MTIVPLAATAALDLALDVASVVVVLACLVATWRVVVGPSAADRVVASDLVTFGVLCLLALVGVRTDNPYTFDAVVVAAAISFLTALSLARALTRGER